MSSFVSQLKSKLTRWTLLFIAALIVLYALYTNGLSLNPPGFYLDESAIAYNAYILAQTGADEAGVAWPLYFHLYTDPFTAYTNAPYLYLLAALDLVFPPSMIVARMLSATLGFAAAWLLGLLALRLSNDRRIGLIVALTALATPWLFEVSRLVFEVALYPLALVLFLLVLERAQTKKSWSWRGSLMIGLTLGLLTYTYSIGRLLAPLLAFGLIFFATNRRRLLDVFQTWAAYAATLIPLLIFNLRHPGALSSRFYLISYIKPQSEWSSIIYNFAKHYLENMSLVSLLLDGDLNQRHHVPTALGSFFIATFILAVIGAVRVFMQQWRDPWWRFNIFGVLVSILPGALTLDLFHTLRLIAYPIFLLVLTVPALNWLLLDDEQREAKEMVKETSSQQVSHARIKHVASHNHVSQRARHAILAVILCLTLAQCIFFQIRFRRDGLLRTDVFDQAYPELLATARAQGAPLIYLFDGMWGPAYAHAYWVSAMQGRGTSDLVHLPYGQRPPAGALVLSSEQNCTNCQIIERRGIYLLYRVQH